MPSTKTPRRRASCVICNRTFVAITARKTCSSSCTVVLGLKTANRNPWREEEEEYLVQLVGEYNSHQLVAKIQALQERKGWPVRNARSVLEKAQRMNLPLCAETNNISGRQLARMLGISPHRVASWRKFGGLKFVKTVRLYSITAEKFQSWAYENEHRLYGITPHRLNWLMADLQFCEKVAKLEPPSRARSVMRCDTGQTWPTITAAATANGLVVASLGGALRYRDGLLKGKQWAFVGKT